MTSNDGSWDNNDGLSSITSMTAGVDNELLLRDFNTTPINQINENGGITEKLGWFLLKKIAETLSYLHYIKGNYIFIHSFNLFIHTTFLFFVSFVFIL